MDQLIESGRAYYYLGTDSTISGNQRSDYLAKSRLAYRTALDYTTDAKQIVSIHRNLAMANWKETQCSSQIERNGFFIAEGKIRTTFNLIAEALKYFSYCTMLGIKLLQPNEWLQDIRAKVSSVCLEFSLMTSTLSVRERLGRCEKLLSSTIYPVYKGEVFIKAANIVYKAAVLALEQRSFNECNQFIAETLQYLERARPLADEYIKGIIEDIEGSCLIHKCSCDSVKFRKIGDEIFKKAIQKDETVNFELIWDCVDNYRQAVICTRETDTENEAKAYSRLGRLFRLVLKMPEKAHTYYKQAFNLAKSLNPRDFSRDKWYKDCVTSLQKYQEIKAREEETLKNSENEPYLKELEQELKAIKAIHDSDNIEVAILLLKHIYTAHPPKVGTPPDVSTITRENVKDCIKKAFIFYHSDKQSDQPKKWQVLCGEITKHLSSIFTYFKGL